MSPRPSCPRPTAPQVFAVEFLPGQFDQRADFGKRVHPADQPGRAPRGPQREGVPARTATLSDRGRRRPSSTTSSTPSRRARQRLSSATRWPWHSPSPSRSRCSRASSTLTPRAWRSSSPTASLAMDVADLAFCQQYFAERRPLPDHHRDQDDRHLLVRSLPSHHVRHRDRPTLQIDDHARAGRLRPVYGHAQRAGSPGEARLPDGHGHHRREVA